MISYQTYSLVLIAICFYIIFQDRNVSDYLILQWQLFLIQTRTKLIAFRLKLRLKYDDYIIQRKLKSIRKKKNDTAICEYL